MGRDRTLLDAAMMGYTAWLESPSLDDNGWLVTTPPGNTALHIALKWGHAGFAKILSDKCPRLLEVANSIGDTPLHCVARTGGGGVASHFLGHVLEAPGMLAPTPGGDTALHEAIRGGHIDVVRALVEVGEPGVGVGHRPENLDHVQRLVNSVNACGESPLYLAAGKSSEMVDLLLQSVAVVHGGPNDRTALHAAVMKQDEVIVCLLLANFPELVVRQDMDRKTALHYAASLGSTRMVDLLLKEDFFIAYLVDNNGHSPLHVAASMGHVQVVETILKRCPDCTDITDATGKNVLHAAVGREQSKMVKYILKTLQFQGLINQPDAHGDTPLHLAVGMCSLNMVRILSMDRRVNMGALNSHGYTALDIIRFDDRSQMLLRRLKISLLLRLAGAKDGPTRAEINVSQVRRIETDTVSQLLAILIATITFTAAFTIPGGYKNGGVNEGEATLGTTAGFKAFLISDTVALCSSATVPSCTCGR